MTSASSAGLRVRVAPRADGLHREVLAPTPEALDLDPAVFRDVEVDLSLDLRDRRVRVAFIVRATARLECDRTLDLYDEAVEGAYEVLFVPPDGPLAEAADDEAVAVLPADATHVDLAPAVRDTLLLALPLRCVSPAAREMPLPTAFGAPTDDAGAPSDDRWDALRALRGDGGPS